MDIEIKLVEDKQAWDNFLSQVNPNTFLQSHAWGDLQAKHGEGVRYLGIYQAKKLIGIALVLTVNAKRGRHLFIPHGPILKSPDLAATILPHLVNFCRDLAKQDKTVALRIAPLLLNTEENKRLFKQLGFRPAPLHVHAERTWNLDLTPSEEELLQGMRKTTRHAIKKAEQAGTEAGLPADLSAVASAKAEALAKVGPDALERFWNLYGKTKARHNFTPFSKQFLQDQLDIFGDQALLVIAEHNGQDLAAGIFIHQHNTVFYHHGASAKLDSKLPASQALQWAAIKEAKRRGATRYNFWGIEPTERSEGVRRSLGRRRTHPFSGITIFKQGFGGYEEDYLHAQDLPLSLGYFKLLAIERYRKFKRGF